MSFGKQIRLAGLLATALAITAFTAFAWGHTQADQSFAGGVGGMAVDCDGGAGGAAGIQTACQHNPGATFDVDVHVTDPPAGGNAGWQSKLLWTDGAVIYLPRLNPDNSANAGADSLWVDCDVAARSDNYPPDPSLLSACVPFPPINEPNFVGAVLTYQFQCETDPQPISPPPGLPGPGSELTLIPRVGDPQQGTHFLDATNNPIDPTLAGATVVCVQGVDEPTPTPGGPTQTPGGPTATPTEKPLEPGVNIRAEDDTVEAGGSTTLTITVLDENLQPVADADCTVSVTDQPGTGASVSPTSVTTDANGEAEVTLNVGSDVGTVEVTADCGSYGSQVLAVEVTAAGLPPTGVGASDSGMNAGLWAIIGLVLAAAAAGLALSGWRYARTRA